MININDIIAEAIYVHFDTEEKVKKFLQLLQDKCKNPDFEWVMRHKPT